MAAVEGDPIRTQPRKRQRRAPLADSTNMNNNTSRFPGNTPKRTRKPAMPLVTYDEEKNEYRIELRSAGPKTKCKSTSVQLSRPDAGEECMIAQEPMVDYKLPFLRSDAAICEDKPELVKASLPCGHSFNALALLYHFAKNAMTCPCCRAGHAKTVLSDASIPPHIRRAFTRRLLEARAEETREQITSDALLAARTLETEVSLSHLPSNLTRVALILSVWDSTDENSIGRIRFQLEVPLTSSLSQTGMVFESFGYSLHQLNLNLRLLPFRPRAFDLSVAVTGSYSYDFPLNVLFRTAPFPTEGAGTRVVFAMQPDNDGNFQGIEVVTDTFLDGSYVFSRLRWAVPFHVFATYLANMQSV